MNQYLKFDFNESFRSLLCKELDTLGIPYTLIGLQKIHFQEILSEEEISRIKTTLAPFHIELTDNLRQTLVQKIKIAIDEMLKDEDAGHITVSEYLSNKLNYSYSYLSSTFSAGTYTSIEHYIILRKVDFIKEYLLHSEMNLTEITFKLNYSSVAHLSRQFKKTTGLTPSEFTRIMRRRKSKTH